MQNPTGWLKQSHLSSENSELPIQLHSSGLQDQMGSWGPSSSFLVVGHRQIWMGFSKTHHWSIGSTFRNQGPSQNPTETRDNPRMGKTFGNWKSVARHPFFPSNDKYLCPLQLTWNVSKRGKFLSLENNPKVFWLYTLVHTQGHIGKWEARLHNWVRTCSVCLSEPRLIDLT